jgi:hypothetical protein
MTDSVCRLPPADRAQRTADFRALFDGTSIGRARIADGVRWTLAAGAATEAQSRRLAELEARCCDGVRFAVERRGDAIVWEITGPPASQATLDAFYELPILMRSDEGAQALWDALDGGACGPPATSRPPAP